jgi:hypothetical protein
LRHLPAQPGIEPHLPRPKTPISLDGLPEGSRFLDVMTSDDLKLMAPFARSRRSAFAARPPLATLVGADVQWHGSRR